MIERRAMLAIVGAFSVKLIQSLFNYILLLNAFAII